MSVAPCRSAFSLATKSSCFHCWGSLRAEADSFSRRLRVPFLWNGSSNISFPSLWFLCAIFCLTRLVLIGGQAGESRSSLPPLGSTCFCSRNNWYRSHPDLVARGTELLFCCWRLTTALLWSQRVVDVPINLMPYCSVCCHFRIPLITVTISLFTL